MDASSDAIFGLWQHVDVEMVVVPSSGIGHVVYAAAVVPPPAFRDARPGPDLALPDDRLDAEQVGVDVIPNGEQPPMPGGPSFGPAAGGSKREVAGVALRV